MTARIRTALVVGLVSLGVAAPTADAAKSTTDTRPTAAVSLGDSYISGEAGRWEGNSVNPAGDRDGTDRAFTGFGYDISQVYEPPSDRNGCHRSDVAEIRSAQLPVSEKINIACSGAKTKNIFRESRGGERQTPDEATQADKLATVAKEKQVKVVVLSIGGNDLGFSSIVSACLQAYTAGQDPCEPSQQQKINQEMPSAMANVGKAIDEVRAAMKSAGSQPKQYRLILQSYPSAIARGSELRVPEWNKAARTSIDGCPFYDSDATWGRDSAVSQISDNLKSVAANKGVQFLDLRDLLEDREMCSTSTGLADAGNPPSETTSDWARFLNVSAVQTQGQLQETFHPNAYAQRALGRCLELFYAQTANQACANTPGGGTNAVVLKPPAG